MAVHILQKFEFLTDYLEYDMYYNLNFLTDKTSNEKQPLCQNSFLYFISTPSNPLLLCLLVLPSI